MRRCLLLGALALAACSGGGIGGSGGGSGGSPPPEPAAVLYPDLATLYAQGIAGTCALNQGVCHSQREYPELGVLSGLTGLVGAPCQLGIQDPAQTLPQCEIPGDHLFVGGQDYEILSAAVADTETFPPLHADLRLPAAPPSLDAAGARVHRPAAKGGDALSRSLAGVAISAGLIGTHVVLDLTNAVDPGLASFLDVRAWHGDRVRMGDPNGDGYPHASTLKWREITPGDPAKSFLYQRLATSMYGPEMPLIPRTWGALATRAVWCWIEGLPAGATPDTIDPGSPIDYARCPPE